MYQIAIPTHRRSDSIGNKTLNVLKEYPKGSIDIFISDVEDMQKYQKNYSEYNLILTNTKTATEKFNFIQSYYADKYVVVLEDDIKEIQCLINKTNKEIIDYCVQYCISRKYKCFGVYPSANKFFMKNSIEVGLTYLVANLFCFKAEKDSRLLCKLPAKTDYERSLRYYEVYGNLVRFNFISCLTNNYSNKGGMQENKSREDDEKYSSLALCSAYPKVFAINKARKSKYVELKMAKKVLKKQINTNEKN